MSWREKAAEKLAAEYKAGTYGRCAEIMKAETKAALENFAAQNEEFAQAIVQGGTFSECMKFVEKGVKGSGLSDLEAYRRAVTFYFKGATVEIQMNIRLEGDPERDTEPAGVILDLTQFL